MVVAIFLTKELFSLKMIFTLITITCLLATIVSFISLLKEKSYLGSIPYFLALTTLVEGTGYLVYFILHKPNNYWVFNAFLPVEILYFSWLFYKILPPTRLNRFFLIAGTILFIATYLSESFQSSFTMMSNNAKKIAGFYITLLCLLYYYGLFKSKEYIELNKSIEFWIISGCFLFYVSSIVCDIFFDYLLIINYKNLKPVRYIIFIFLNLVMYGCWSYGFLCKYRQKI